MKTNISLSQAKLSEIVIENVDIPKKGKIQFVRKAPRFNGKKAVDGSCAKIKCEFIDSELVKILEKANADISQLKTTTLEIVSNNEMDLLDISEDDLLGAEFPLQNAKVMLKWDSHIGNWSSLKLVLNLDDLNDNEANANG